MFNTVLRAPRARRTRAPWFAVIALVLASCSGGDAEPEAEPVDVSTTVAAVAEDTTTEVDMGIDFDWDAECAEGAGDDLPAEGGVCADSGLRPETGGFSFENWGGPVEADAVTVEHAVAMFGVEATCARDDADGCVPYPAVTQWIESMNSGMEGGRCEGMAVLSQAINDGYMSVADLQDAAAVTADLERDAPAVAANISYWWATQSLPSIADFNESTRSMSPVEIARDVARALREREGVTLGIYFEGGGHAVTPIAVTWDGEATIDILVYDNNYPGAINRVAIDTTSETWSYAGAALNPDEVSDGWSGSTGTMDYTLMGVRQGEQVPPWAEGDGADESVRVSVNTAGRSIAGVEVTVGGVVIDSRDLSSAAEGVRIFPSRGRIGTGTTVEIPAGLTDVTVRPIAGDQESPWFAPQRLCNGPCPDDSEDLVDLILDVDMPGAGSLHIEDELTAGVEGSEPFALKLSTAGPFQATLDVADGADVQAAYALGDQSLDMSLEDGQDFGIVQNGDDGAFDLDVYDAEGAILYELLFDGDLDGETLAGLLFDIDEETGELILGEDLWEAEELDEAFDDLFLGDDEVGDDGSEEDDASAESEDSDTNADDPTGDDSDSDDSTGDDSGTDDSTGDDSGTDDSGTDDSGTDDSGTDDSSGDDPGTDEPTADDPTTDDPPADGPATDDGG